MRRVLIVEDDAALRQLLLSFFTEELEIEADGVGTGEDALNILDEQRYDLLVLDWNLPDKDGGAILHTLEERTPCPPAVLVISSDSCAARAAQVFGVSYLSKPFELDALLSCVVSCVF